MSFQIGEEKRIVNYLLGDLPEEERERLEARFFADEEYREAIRAVEDDLIDDYVRGELAPGERERFEGLFSASPRRQRKIEFAKALAQATASATASATAAATLAAPASSSIASWWTGLLASLRSPGWAFQASLLAAAALLVAGCVWLFAETGRLRSEIAGLRAERQTQQQQEQAAQQEIIAQRERGDELAGQLQGEQAQRAESAARAEQLRRERDRLAQEANAGRRAGGVAPATIASFVLSPGLVRGSDEPARLTLPPSARLMRLRLDIEAGDEYPRYRAELRTVGGNMIWSSDQLTLRRAGAGGQSVVLTLPAALLDSGEYELTLRGVIGRGEFTDVGYYYFSILKR